MGVSMVPGHNLLAAWSQRLLETGLRDFAGSKGMIGHHGWSFSHHEREVRVRDCLAETVPGLHSSGFAHRAPAGPGLFRPEGDLSAAPE
jgi:hypothetical protein